MTPSLIIHFTQQQPLLRLAQHNRQSFAQNLYINSIDLHNKHYDLHQFINHTQVSHKHVDSINNTSTITTHLSLSS